MYKIFMLLSMIMIQCLPAILVQPMHELSEAEEHLQNQMNNIEIIIAQAQHAPDQNTLVILNDAFNAFNNALENINDICAINAIPHETEIAGRIANGNLLLNQANLFIEQILALSRAHLPAQAVG